VSASSHNKNSEDASMLIASGPLGTTLIATISIAFADSNEINYRPFLSLKTNLCRRWPISGFDLGLQDFLVKVRNDQGYGYSDLN